MSAIAERDDLATRATRAGLLARVAGFYAIVDLPDAGEAESASHARRLGGQLIDGGATVVQLRIKGGAARSMLAALAALRPLCAGRATLVVNDRLDVAIAADADGVHLGQDDLPIAIARRIAPPTMLIGISTHDEDQARAAAAAGADYLGFGPVFPTRTKQDPDPVVGLDRLARVCAALALPIVGIGGIDLDAAHEVARAGAAAAAIISAVNQAPDPAAAARRVVEAFKR